MAMSAETVNNRGTPAFRLWLGCRTKYHQAAMATTPTYNTVSCGKKRYLNASRNTRNKGEYLNSSTDLRYLAKHTSAPRKSVTLRKIRSRAVRFQDSTRWNPW